MRIGVPDKQCTAFTAFQGFSSRLSRACLPIQEIRSEFMEGTSSQKATPRGCFSGKKKKKKERLPQISCPVRLPPCLNIMVVSVPQKAYIGWLYGSTGTVLCFWVTSFLW